jgi:hypothetical protein
MEASLGEIIMVKLVRGFYVCEYCKLAYKEKEWAAKCQEWCLANHSCNLEITKHAEK